MASSNPALIPVIARWIWNLKPKTVLDVGCGFGRYGFLCRDILEICHLRYKKEEWKTKIDAVEIFSDFITPIHSYLYDQIFIEDIKKWNYKVTYDLIILGDVIEHMEKEEAWEVIRKLKKICTWMIIQTPYGEMKSPVVFNNPAEEHKSGWLPEDFNEFYPEIQINSNIFAVLIRGDLD